MRWGIVYVCILPATGKKWLDLECLQTKARWQSKFVLLIFSEVVDVLDLHCQGQLLQSSKLGSSYVNIAIPSCLNRHGGLNRSLDHFEYINSTFFPTRSGEPKLVTPFGRSNELLNNYFFCHIRLWNSLPPVTKLPIFSKKNLPLFDLSNIEMSLFWPNVTDFK